MFVKQIYTDCLAEAAYYIESNSQAVVIDPIRDIDSIVSLAAERKATITHIFETHFHADFISGHIELADALGATIVFGPTAETNYKIHNAVDGEQFKIGDLTLTALHTPGHTLESTCYLLKDETGKDVAVFTGDTVFVGDVGRPDLAVKSDLSAEQLAEMLYNSIETKIKPLADDVVIYPGHGAGSACGKNMGTERSTTVADQKKLNYAFLARNKNEFVRLVLDGQSEPPQYFSSDVLLNKTGYALLNFLLEKSYVPVSANEVKKAQENGVMLLDVRSTGEFSEGHINGAISLATNGQFATWFGTLFPLSEPVILICNTAEDAKNAIIRLARVGFENVQGFYAADADQLLADGFNVETLQSIEASQLTEEMTILDVRNAPEFDVKRVQDAITIPLAEIETRSDELDMSKTYYVHCKSGYRSVIASSILQRQGFKNLVNVLGGFTAIENENRHSFEEGACPMELKKRQTMKVD
jgi:glyoxylase-like metal-dependent hydrolase (beta-lactamase superfamily II)/rhodanese-related sulfurtransferase